jgi:hypothetical protein
MKKDRASSERCTLHFSMMTKEKGRKEKGEKKSRENRRNQSSLAYFFVSVDAFDRFVTYRQQQQQ